MHARAPDPEAFLYLQKSRVHYYRFNKQDNAIARELATKATKISPDYPDAWEWRGYTEQQGVAPWLFRSGGEELANVAPSLTACTCCVAVAI